MRIILFFLFFCILFSSASNSYSQEFTIKSKTASIKEVCREIEKGSDYVFIFSDNSEKLVDKKVNVEAHSKNVAEILDIILSDTGLTYRILDKQIVVYKSTESAPSVAVEQPDINIIQQPAKKQITGRVVDAQGEAIIGANIIEQGTTNGTVTDVNGNFSLDVENNATIRVSYIGYLEQSIATAGQTTFNITLQEDTQALDELIVIGYGVVKKSDLTGSVSSVKAAELTAIPKSSFLQALQGRSTGVHVKQNSGAPGSGVTVRIRGTNSIQGGNDPLYVIDGFPSFSSNPTVLDPADIESIEILKDASAIAIYGSRGSNGVIMITTKKGKTGKTKVDFGTTLGYQSLTKKMELMNAKEYMTFYNLQRTNDGLAPYFDLNAPYEDFDWQDFIFTTAPIRTHSLTVSGGNEKTKFAISGNIFDQQGIIKGGSYSRYSFRANLDHEISKRMTVNSSTVLSRLMSDSKNSEGGRQGGTLVSGSLGLPPTLTPYNDDGTYRVIHTSYPFLTEAMSNPLNIINERSQLANVNRILSNLSFTYQPIDGLYLKILGGVESSDDRTDTHVSLNYYNSTGSASVSTSQTLSLLNENTISYVKTFARKHNVSAVAGFTYQDYTTKSLGGSGTGFLSDVTQTGNLGSATTPGVPSSGYSKWVLLSSIARVNYNFDSRYYFTFSFRADGSSRYSEGDKWGYFPSSAVAWRLGEEQFMKNVSWISDLKLRASYGITGSQAIGAYSTLNNLGSGLTVFGNSRYVYFAPGTRLPGKLKWESTGQFDVGVDVGVMSNRFQFTADYYIKETRDLLNTVTLPYSMGYASSIQNVGQIRNKGFEFSFDANVLNGEFQWILNGNISFNRSEVKKLYGGEDILGGRIDFLQLVDDGNLLREGEPIGIFYGYLKDGYDANGAEKYKDLNADGIINQLDKTKIGDPNPNFIYGLNSFMSYKGFELALFIQGSQGNDLLNATSIDNTLRYGYGMNQMREVLYNHWTPENPNAKYPKITRNYAYRFSDRQIENGSYLRLKNVELAYNMPVQKWNISWLERVKVYVSLQNFLTITKYSGWDPDVNSQGSGIGQGIDQNPYPVAKSYTFGINVGF